MNLLGRSAGARSRTGAFQGRALWRELSPMAPQAPLLPLRHCSRPLPLGMDRRAWPSYSHRIEGVHERRRSRPRLEPTPNWNGRKTRFRLFERPRRGTEDFLGRVGDTTQSQEPRTKVLAVDPVDVFGAASAATMIADKPSARIKPFGLCILQGHNAKRRNQSSGFRSAPS